MIDVEIALDIADVAIRVFEHGDVETFLAAEIVIDHPFARTRARGDLVDSGAAQALVREFLARDGDDVPPGLLAIVDPPRFSVRCGPAHRAANRCADIFHGNGNPT